MLNLAIFGSGSGTNAQAIIDAIEAGRLNARICCILSDVEDATILERARKHHIPAFYIDCSPFRSKLEGRAEDEVLQILSDHKVEWVALAGFMRIIRQKLLRAYPGRIINIHPSLLPSFPGLDAGKQAFEYGVKFTGCTVHFVDEGVDTGAIINQKCVQIEPNDSLEGLMKKIHEQEHLAYPEALEWLASEQIVVEGRRVKVQAPKQ